MPGQGIFALTNGFTMIDHMDEANNKIWRNFGADILKLTKRKPRKDLSSWRKAAMQEWKRREIIRLSEENIADMRIFVYRDHHEEISPLLKAIGRPAEFLNSRCVREHAEYLSRKNKLTLSDKSARTKPKPTVDQSKAHLPEQALTVDNSMDKQQLVAVVPDDAHEAKKHQELTMTAEDDNDNFDPVAFHAVHQQRKMVEAAAESGAAALSYMASNCYITPEMADFLRQSVYVGEQDRCSWRDFETAVSRNGFRVDTTQKGSVRRVVHIESGKRFTVHSPHDETERLLREYTSFIRSGFERVFDFNL